MHFWREAVKPEQNILLMEYLQFFPECMSCSTEVEERKKKKKTDLCKLRIRLCLPRKILSILTPFTKKDSIFCSDEFELHEAEGLGADDRFRRLKLRVSVCNESTTRHCIQ